MKAADSRCPAPAPRIVPAGGEYANAPGTLDVALNCVPPSGVPYVMSAGALHDSEVDVRVAAAWALGQIESPRGVEPLKEAMRDEVQEVRRAAVWALSQIDDPRAEDAVANAAEGDRLRRPRRSCTARRSVRRS